MRWKISILMAVLILALSVTLVIANPLAGGFEIPWWSVDGGGGNSQGGSYTLSGSIGQADAGSASGGGYTLSGGFWSVAHPSDLPPPTNSPEPSATPTFTPTPTETLTPTPTQQQQQETKIYLPLVIR